MYWEKELECIGREELKKLQWERLQVTLNRAYQVPYYRQQWEEAGVRPEDIRGLEDLPRLPFTLKSALRDNYPFGMFAVPMNQVVRLHASSGTTGKPTVVGYTQGDLDMWANLAARSLTMAGGHTGLSGSGSLWLWTVHRWFGGSLWG